MRHNALNGHWSVRGLPSSHVVDLARPVPGHGVNRSARYVAASLRDVAATGRWRYPVKPGNGGGAFLRDFVYAVVRVWC